MNNDVPGGPTTRERPRFRWLLGLAVFALAVRLIGLNYDQSHHFHPDERAIADAVGRLSFEPGNLQLNPRFFAYGSFPLYVTRLATGLAANVPSLRGYDQSILVGRAVSALAGTFTVLLIALLGARLYDRQTGLLAGFLLAACVLHVQNSHYMTTDVFLTMVVLIALYYLVRLVQHGSTLDYVLSGAAIGFATATKFSALPLLAPLGVAMLVRLYRERRFLRVVVNGAAALLALVAALFVGQPYAFLDFELFRRHIDEQSRMVRNAGLLPYTNQYIGMPKYLYEIEQIVLWCMGPALGLAALWATARRTLRTFRGGRGEQLVLLSWVIPYFLVTGWFDVKFPRYLLPIYPIVILWAAAWLREKAQRSRLGRVALGTVLVMTLLHLVAFLHIYFRPHTVVTASEWVYRHVPPGSTLLTEHWDEGFPFDLGLRARHRLKVSELPYYDGERRMPEITQELADADYVALQTKRLYGAVTRDPKKFPLTNNYFYLLFAGDLGYELVYDHASRPSLFGFELYDELGDESLSVYDHPKVLIFQNREHLPAAELLQRVRRGLPSRKLERRDLLLATAAGGPGAGVAEAMSIRSSWVALLFFAILVELLGLAAFQVVRRWLPVPGAYALAKVLGILVFAYVSWLLTNVGWMEFRGRSLGMLFLVLMTVGFFSWRREPDRTRRPEYGATELLFWGTFAFFLIVRALNPEVFWGEKPMDFSFLNSLYRAVTLPPPEPWFAGSTLHYSYFGHYVVAALGKLCSIHPGVVFNLGIALVAGLTAVGAFAAGCALTDRWRVGALAAVFVTLIGNLGGPRNVLDRLQRGVAAHDLFNFDYFWATSRVIKDTINEYPFWSFLFADLHAHVLVMPFSLTFVTLALWWVRRRDVAAAPLRTPPLILLLGLALGAIMTTNTWSTFTYAAFFPFLLGCVSLGRHPLRRGQWLAFSVIAGLSVVLGLLWWFYPRTTQELLQGAGVAPHEVWSTATTVLLGAAAFVLIPGAIVLTGVVGALAVGLYYPYWRDWTAPSRNWGFEGDAFANFYDFATIFGLFLCIAVPYLLLVWRRQLLVPGEARLRGVRRLALWLVGLTALVCLLLTLPFERIAETAQILPFLREGHLSGPEFAYQSAVLTSVRAGLAIFAVLALHLGLQRSQEQRTRLIAILLSFAFFVTAGVDVVHIWDRMNTVFKFYLEAWFLFSVACAGAAWELWRGMQASASKRIWQTTTAALLAVTLFTAATATSGVISTKRVRTPRPTLDGTAYLALRDPHEAAAFEWLNQEIRGIPVIAEAYGPSYQDYARVSMNTGLPTVLGWDYHVYQRAHHWPDINRRKSDLEKLYTTDKKQVAKQILDTYHVSLVFVGKLERRQYAGGNLKRFREWEDLLTPVYENEGVTIFAVQGQFSGATPIQTIEHVPEVEKGEEVAVQAEEGRLTQPRGLAVDAAGNVYVADFGNSRVQKFDAELEFVGGWGGPGDLPGEFKQPGDVGVDGEGKIYVADTWNQRIQIFDPEGDYVNEWGGPFFGPRGIAVTPDGRAYLVDTGNHRVRRFDAKGAELGVIGGPGSEPGQFKEPVGIAIDAEGRIYVCDNGNGRLQIFDADGGFLTQFPVEGWEMKVFSEPHVVVADDGTIWLTVPLRRAVRAYDRGGELLREIVGSDQPGSRFQRPMGIDLMPGGKELVISDLEGRLARLPTEEE